MKPDKDRNDESEDKTAAIAVNPNPAANENIRDKENKEVLEKKTNDVGSEITDGEDA